MNAPSRPTAPMPRSRANRAGIGCGTFALLALLLAIVGTVAGSPKKTAADAAPPATAQSTTAAANTAPATPRTPTAPPTSSAAKAPTRTASPRATTPRHTAAATTAPTKPAVILSPSGRYYRAGEFCPEADADMSTLDAHGNTITCGIESGRYHWHY